jgi:hypothetical protein
MANGRGCPWNAVPRAAPLTCTCARRNMYIMKPGKKARWTMATARQRLPALIGAAAHEPQAVYRRSKLVAAVVGPDAAEKIRAGRPRVAEAFAELRRICAEEGYALPSVRRRNRPNSAVTGGARRRP